MPDLSVIRSDAVVTLVLDRPERRNALTPELIDHLLAELAAIADDRDVRAVVLTGAPPAFCAGFDVDRVQGRQDGAEGADDLADRLAASVAALRVPTLAKVNGPAYGAGCGLALACDLRFASSEAGFAMPPARLGVLYGWEGTQRLVRAVGPSRAKELLFSGEVLPAERALGIGLVDRVVAPHRLDEEVDRFVEAVCGNAPLSVAASKLVVDLVAGGAPGAEALSRIAAASEEVWSSEDAREGPLAFRERRRPEFRGR